jgi:hypothetical protein
MQAAISRHFEERVNNSSRTAQKERGTRFAAGRFSTLKRFGEGFSSGCESCLFTKNMLRYGSSFPSKVTYVLPGKEKGVSFG